MVDVEDVKKVFDDPKASKAIATLDEDGWPHVAPVGSLRMIDENTFAFAVVAMKNTKDNLLREGKASLLAFTPPPEIGGYKVKATFVKFESSGKLFDVFSKSLQKFGLKVQEIGILKAESIEEIKLQNEKTSRYNKLGNECRWQDSIQVEKTVENLWERGLRKG